MNIDDILFFQDNTPDHPAHHTTDATVIAVKAYEQGYYPVYGPRDAAWHTNRNSNRLGVDAPMSHEVESAFLASAFGWHTPAAQAAIDYISRVMGEAA